MGELVLNNETQLEVCPSELFALFGSGDPSLGWLFGAEVPQLRPGSLVRVALPLGGLVRSPGTARVLFRAGECLMTGSLGPMKPVGPGAEVFVDLGALGTVSARLSCV
ncbi:MAG: hypothetical protein J4F50_12380 [Acidimicrobiia bacterium]|nr:hypothetical protein [Acidimicrobiia bacterium]